MSDSMKRSSETRRSPANFFTVSAAMESAHPFRNSLAYSSWCPCSRRASIFMAIFLAPVASTVNREGSCFPGMHLNHGRMERYTLSGFFLRHGFLRLRVTRCRAHRRHRLFADAFLDLRGDVRIVL